MLHYCGYPNMLAATEHGHVPPEGTNSFRPSCKKSPPFPQDAKFQEIIPTTMRLFGVWYLSNNKYILHITINMLNLFEYYY